MLQRMTDAIERWLMGELPPVVKPRFQKTPPKPYDGRAKFRAKDGTETDVGGQPVIVVEDRLPAISDNTASRVIAAQLAAVEPAGKKTRGWLKP